MSHYSTTQSTNAATRVYTPASILVSTVATRVYTLGLLGDPSRWLP